MSRLLVGLKPFNHIGAITVIKETIDKDSTYSYSPPLTSIGDRLTGRPDP